MNLIRNQTQPTTTTTSSEVQPIKMEKPMNHFNTKRVSSFLSHFTFHSHQTTNNNRKKSNQNINSLSITAPESKLQDQIIISPSSDFSSIASPSPITPNNDSLNQIHINHQQHQQHSIKPITTSYFQFPTNKSPTNSPLASPIPTSISISSTSTLTTQSSRSTTLTRSASVLTDESQSLPSSSSSRLSTKPAFIKVLRKLNEQSSPSASSTSSSTCQIQTNQNQVNQISKPSALAPLWESEYVHFPSTKAALEGFIKYRGTLLKHTPPAQAGFWNSKSSKVWKTTLCCLTAIYPHNHPTLNSESTLYNLHIFNTPSPAQADQESARLRLEASSIVCVLENNMAGESLVLKITGREVTKNLDTSQTTETQTSWMFAMEDVSHLKTWMRTFKEIVNELRQNPNDLQPPLSAASTTRSFSSMSHHSTKLDSPSSQLRVPSRQTNINPSLSSMNSIRSGTPNFFGPTAYQSATPKPKSAKSEPSPPIKSSSFHQTIRNEAFFETLRTGESQSHTSPLIRSQSSIPSKPYEIVSPPSSSSSTSLFSLQNSLPCPPRRPSRSLHPNSFRTRPSLSNLIIKRPNTVSSKVSGTDYEHERILIGPLIPPPTAALPPIPDEYIEKISEETVH